MAFVAPFVRHVTPSRLVAANAARPSRAILSRRLVSAATPSAAASPPTPSPARVYDHIGWGAVEDMCARLVALVGDRNYDVILAVTRGGMVPGSMMAQALEVRNVLTATVIFYSDVGDAFFGMEGPRFLAFPAPEKLEGQRVLVVDDVWDSGHTAVAVEKRVKLAGAKVCDVCVLHYKPDMTEYGDLRPEFYAAETSDWVVYPWERISPNFKQDLRPPEE